MRKGVEHYDRALFQAHKALDVIRTIEEEDRQRCMRRKRSLSPDAADGGTETVEAEESPEQEDEEDRGRTRTIDEGMVQRPMARLEVGGRNQRQRVQ